MRGPQRPSALWPHLLRNDPDGDGVPGEGYLGIGSDGDDNCPSVYNPDEADGDGDGIGDACDLWPQDPQPPDTLRRPGPRLRWGRSP